MLQLGRLWSDGAADRPGNSEPFKLTEVTPTSSSPADSRSTPVVTMLVVLALARRLDSVPAARLSPAVRSVAARHVGG